MSRHQRLVSQTGLSESLKSLYSEMTSASTDEVLVVSFFPRRCARTPHPTPHAPHPTPHTHHTTPHTTHHTPHPKTACECHVGHGVRRCVAACVSWRSLRHVCLCVSCLSCVSVTLVCFVSLLYCCFCRCRCLCVLSVVLVCLSVTLGLCPCRRDESLDSSHIVTCFSVSVCRPRRLGRKPFSSPILIFACSPHLSHTFPAIQERPNDNCLTTAPGARH